jgi:hypothetical protein
MTLLVWILLSQVVIPVPPLPIPHPVPVPHPVPGPPPIPIPPPGIAFPVPPPLVVIQPGIQVVEDYSDEVFFTGGYYWHRRNGHWFRTRAHNGPWVVVEERIVPRPLVAFHPGSYRHYRKAVKHELREERREQHHNKGHGKKRKN